MPRGKRPLSELSDRQFNRRLRNDPLEVLLGQSYPSHASHNIELSDIASDSDSRAESFETCSNCSNSVVTNTEHDIACGSADSPLPVTEDNSGPMAVCGSESPLPLNHGGVCLSCLVCRCVECAECKHDINGCNHCNECLNGENLDSDLPPESSEDEDPGSLIESHPSGVVAEDSEVENSNDFSGNLAQWALRNNISHNSLRELMSLLNSSLKADLPKDPRTLLSTPSKVTLRACPPGLYWHAGLENGLLLLDLQNVDSIVIKFNVDGIPISKSSRSSFWPILCLVENFSNVILAGVYHGHDKPNDSNDLMREFVDELKNLCSNGLVVNGRKLCVKVRCMVCDAVAKCFLLKIKGHCGYFGCTKCIQEGEYIERRVVYPEHNAPLRTDSDFRSQKQEEHHLGNSILTEIPDFDLIKGVPLDYMHLILLGVIRKLLILFTSGKVGVRLQGRVINQINQVLESLPSFIPNDYGRKTRSLIYLRIMKAVEFRLLGFYVGPVALFPLQEDYEERYKHFLLLHVAVTILSSNALFEHYGTSYPHELLVAFVKGFKNLYGAEQISHNVHNLVHLVDDVANHGVLDNFSAFPFENYLQETKKVLRKGDKPLQQLARRYIEAKSIIPRTCVRTAENVVQYSGRSTCLGSTLHGCGQPFYRSAKLKKFSLDLSPANRYCGLADEGIVEIHNFAYHRRLKCMVIVGKYFKTKVDFYDYPLPSSHLGIYLVRDLSELMYWPIESVCRKYVRLPFKSAHVVFPIIHTVSSCQL